MPRRKPTGAQIIGALLKAGGRGLGQYYELKEETAQAEEEKRSRSIRDAYNFALTQRLNAELDEAAIQKRILENIAHSYRQPHAAKLGSAPILPTKLEEARQRIKTGRQKGARAPAPTYRPDLLKTMATDPAALVQGSQALKNFTALIQAAQTTGAFPKEEKGEVEKRQKELQKAQTQWDKDVRGYIDKNQDNFSMHVKLDEEIAKGKAGGISQLIIASWSGKDRGKYYEERQRIRNIIGARPEVGNAILPTPQTEVSEDPEIQKAQEALGRGDITQEEFDEFARLRNASDVR